MRKSLAYSVTAFLLWGLLPLYWRQLNAVSSFAILNIRTVTSALFGLFFLFPTGTFAEFKSILRERSKCRKLLFSGISIYLNWYFYIWGVTHNHVIDAGMGLFLIPMMLVLTGKLLYKEPWNKAEIVSAAVTAFGVLVFVFSYGTFPWLACCIAVTSCAYGTLKKGVDISGVVSVTIETLLIAPFAVIAWVLCEVSNLGIFSAQNSTVTALSFLSGLATFLPLWLYSIALQKASLSSIGFLQYLNPLIQIVLGVLVFKEHLSPAKTIMLLCICLGLCIYLFHLQKHMLCDKKQNKEEHHAIGSVE